MDNDGCSKIDYSTNPQNFVDFPVRLLKFIFSKLKIKGLFQKYIQDPRSRVDDYPLDSLLILALCTHIFRSPSKNNFRQHLVGDKAARSLAKFAGSSLETCPAVRTIDDVLIKLNPEQFIPILPDIFRTLLRQRCFQLHPEYIPNGEYAVLIDAQVTHTYYDHNQHPCICCPYCLKRTRGNQTWYLHLDLVATFVAPNGFQIPLLMHRVRAHPEWGQLGDDQWKQECERTAFPLLLKELRKQFPRLKFCLHLDALYATDPVLQLLKELKMGYSIVRKAKVIKTVGEDCNGLKQFSEPVNVDKENKRFQVHQKIHFFNEVAYREHSLNIIQIDEESVKKPSKRFAKVQSIKTHWEWVVHQTLTPSNVAEIAGHSRIRWREEDCFNTLQHRGFSITHDFNRAPNAQTVRTYLILIAYALTSVLTYSCLGKNILSKGNFTISFVMAKMLQDLIYLTEDQLFNGYVPFQLRFAKDPP